MVKEKLCADVENITHLEKCVCVKNNELQNKLKGSPLYAKQGYHSGKVLLGNWFEDSCVYQKNKYDHNTEYLSEYGIKTCTTHPRSILWDATIKAEGNEVVSGNYIDKDQERYMSSYYLSYELLPVLAKQAEGNRLPSNAHKVGKSKCHEQYENYGNQGNYGLAEYKRSIWEREKNDPRSTAETLGEITYIQPTNDFYKFYRWNCLRPFKGKYGDEYPPLPPFHPRLDVCNPLTWECKPLVPRPM